MLGAIGGENIITPNPNDVAGEANATRIIAADIIGNIDNARLSRGPVAWITSDGRAHIAPEPFLPLVGENHPANRRNGLPPRNITIGIGGAGEVTTMFAE